MKNGNIGGVSFFSDTSAINRSVEVVFGEAYKDLGETEKRKADNYIASLVPMLNMVAGQKGVDQTLTSTERDQAIRQFQTDYFKGAAVVPGRLFDSEYDIDDFTPEQISISRKLLQDDGNASPTQAQILMLALKLKGEDVIIRE